MDRDNDKAATEMMEYANDLKLKESHVDGPPHDHPDLALQYAQESGPLLSPKEERSLIWKIDMTIIPLIAICYIFFYIDKTTLSYAGIFGLKDILKGDEYNWLSSAFYFGFLVWSFPTNLIMQRTPIGKYLGFNIFLWGVFLMLQAPFDSFGGICAFRVISGAAEACADPAYMLITGMWYTRREQPKRIGLWYSANGLGIAFGGLLGFGIGQIKSHIPSWKLEFIIIGAVCCLWGIVISICMPDSPLKARFLSQDEKRHIVWRLRENQTGIRPSGIKWHQVREALADYRVYSYFLIGMVANGPNGGISNFGTLIINGFGYTRLQTTLLQIPYGILISLLVLVCVFLNDKLPANKRTLVAILFLLPNIAGCLGLRYVPSDMKVARLWMYYLTGSYNASFVLVLSLPTANIAGHSKRSVSNALLFLGYCVGNIAGPFFFKTGQAPKYSLGIWMMFTCHLIQLLLLLVLRYSYMWDNARRDRLYGPQVIVTEDAYADLTDKENKNFRYVY